MKNELMKRCYDVKLETRENNGVGIIEGQPIVFGSRTNPRLF